MSRLDEAYSLAHTAQCRLNLEASRPGRNLRFVVGHLMHYESLRLRIVEIEDDLSRHRAAHAKDASARVADHRLQRRPSSGQLRRTHPPPSAIEHREHVEEVAHQDHEDDDDDINNDEADLTDEDDIYPDDDQDDDDLSLSRFPSGSARLTQHPSHPPEPDLEPDLSSEDDEEEEDDDDLPLSPQEPSAEALRSVVDRPSDDRIAEWYEGMRKCPCHGKTDAPAFESMWELPAAEDGSARDGVTRAVGKMAATSAEEVALR